MTEHVTDDLELYAVGALRPREAERVGAHLAECPVCREELAEIATAVNALPDMVLLREPPAGLKERILSAAAADVPAGSVMPVRRETSWTFRPAWSWLGIGGLAAAALLFLVLDLNSLRDLRAARGPLADSRNGRWAARSRPPCRTARRRRSSDSACSRSSCRAAG